MKMPLWPRIAITLFLCVLVPVYWVKYGPANFLWYSDIALFLTALALWLENRLLLGMAAVGTLLPESAWCVDFLVGLTIGASPFGLAAYMFDGNYPLYLRGLSLFHLALPPLWIWMLHRMRYDRRALPAQAILGTIVLLITYALTDPAKNINWVFGPGAGPQSFLPPLLYLAALVLFMLLVVFLPTHLLLKRLFP
jgi:hypothetical protein